MKKLLRTGLALGAVTLAAGTALVGGATTSAQAGPLCSTTGICGTITNYGSSTGNILAGENWSDSQGRPTGKTITLSPRESSGGQLHDADGYYVPSGCTKYVQGTTGWRKDFTGPRWVKVTDNFQGSVYVTC
ncbi:hypothetical protein [Nocardioides lijunqiniae]|uniref:hypothetical protein n=1 Tax=Nocardioides lijunqiniae TaxID=2760832 RepID=UPI001877B68A|nr:hypothetical protein [Nocardioides lijunqiniae]